jgi:hypothetical protein
MNFWVIDITIYYSMDLMGDQEMQNFTRYTCKLFLKFLKIRTGGKIYSFKPLQMFIFFKMFSKIQCRMRRGGLEGRVVLIFQN